MKCVGVMTILAEPVISDINSSLIFVIFHYGDLTFVVFLTFSSAILNQDLFVDTAVDVFLVLYISNFQWKLQQFLHLSLSWLMPVFVAIIFFNLFFVVGNIALVIFFFLF